MVEDLVEREVEKIKAAIIERARIEEEQRTLHPIKVRPSNVVLAGDINGSPPVLASRFNELMQQAAKGKTRVSGFLVVTHEKANEVDIVNFNAADRKWGSTWIEDQVIFKDSQDKHTFRIQVQEKMGCEVAVNDLPPDGNTAPRDYTVYRGFSRYLERVATLIPSEEDPDD